MRRNSPEINRVYELLRREFSKNRMPVVELIEAQTNDPFKVLVATLLSARTKDAVTAAASQRLFEKAPTADALAGLPVRVIEKLIYPVGFFREKAKHLAHLPHALADLYNGDIPSSVEELVKLPGVGRKTANLVVAVGFNKPAVCVDVHVHRIFNRLGFLCTRSPLETEMVLRKWLPEKYWTTFNSYFVSFGQHTCFPINPRCDRCPVYRHCARIEVKTKFARR